MNSVSLPAWVLGAAAGVVLLLVLLVGLLVVGARRRARRQLVEAEASEAELRERLEALEKRLTEPEPGQISPRRRRREEKEYVITSLGEDGDQAEVEQVPQRTLTAPAFADAVFRETLVHSAALVHGVRRALSPEVRFKIRYEMHREVKRSRKDRKSEMREALREHRARQRAAMADDDRDVRMEDSA
ncbi:hypothetical protein FB381_2190 [Nocardioides albertanoniae]|uniref:Uncharacterized protein n=1 Tax=Nocardioides albertanoniae TaxID=1175486 RepID=A0A543A6R6_9ACTN|nr:hypothetical protein [Nocardioides albertanoniae]TQL68301.1 hypothetical protein FB381_2190 [Nocardioides albertanoniae]